MADVIMQESVPCEFDVAWVGKCGHPSTNKRCSRHEKLLCCSCGARATRECEQTNNLVCGAYLCSTCQHSYDGRGHVRGEVYAAQVKKALDEEVKKTISRTSPVQRLDESGNPLNLFELLKKAPTEQGYILKEVYFLELVHGLMGFFPAVIHKEKRIIMSLDKSLMIEIWKTLEPRSSRMCTSICYVNEKKAIAYAHCRTTLDRENSKQQRLLTRREYEEKIFKYGTVVEWAPGLLGADYDHMKPFSEYVDELAARVH